LPCSNIHSPYQFMLLVIVLSAVRKERPIIYTFAQ
jgi:hypothetical protein